MGIKQYIGQVLLQLGKGRSKKVIGEGERVAGTRTSKFEVIKPFNKGVDEKRLKQLETYGPKEKVGKGSKPSKNKDKNKGKERDETTAPQQKRRSTFVPPRSSPPPNPPTTAIPPPPVLDLWRKSVIPPPPSSPPPSRERLWIKLFDPDSSIEYYQHTQHTRNCVWERPDDYDCVG